jgi:hypothetical protein
LWARVAASSAPARACGSTLTTPSCVSTLRPSLDMHTMSATRQLSGSPLISPGGRSCASCRPPVRASKRSVYIKSAADPTRQIRQHLKLGRGDPRCVSYAPAPVRSQSRASAFRAGYSLHLAPPCHKTSARGSTRKNTRAPEPFPFSSTSTRVPVRPSPFPTRAWPPQTAAVALYCFNSWLGSCHADALLGERGYTLFINPVLVRCNSTLVLQLACGT